MEKGLLVVVGTGRVGSDGGVSGGDEGGIRWGCWYGGIGSEP